MGEPRCLPWLNALKWYHFVVYWSFIFHFAINCNLLHFIWHNITDIWHVQIIVLAILFSAQSNHWPSILIQAGSNSGKVWKHMLTSSSLSLRVQPSPTTPLLRCLESRWRLACILCVCHWQRPVQVVGYSSLKWSCCCECHGSWRKLLVVTRTVCEECRWSSPR